jgi:hypothetical protein
MDSQSAIPANSRIECIAKVGIPISIHIKLQDTGFLFMKTTVFIVYF